jgi:hypothetical protein
MSILYYSQKSTTSANAGQEKTQQFEKQLSLIKQDQNANIHYFPLKIIKFTTQPLKGLQNYTAARS